MKKIGIVGIISVLAWALYELTLPAINIHSIGFVLFIFAISFIAVTLLFFAAEESGKKLKADALVLLFGVLSLGSLAVLLVGSLTSSPIVKSKDYAKILTPYVQQGHIADYEATINNVPLLDKESADLIANREFGGLADMISQFEVATSHQITVNGKPIRVAPLKHGGLIKWYNNKGEIPGYIVVDMRTQEAELIRVEGGIKYSVDVPFLSKYNVIRHIKKEYRNLMFTSASFELDETGKAFWIVGIKEKTIGLFGGSDISAVLTVDAQNGDIEKYNIGEVPEWIDSVYPTSMIMRQYDNYGKYQDGFLNAIFAQKGVKVTTKGYNYIPQGDDNWIYTGVTSGGRDESNIGFILANKRTKEVIYYSISGAEEYSAMESAEGAVQHLGYTSTFPLLLQVEGAPTYVVALKDNAGLVKMYAMVNVEKYQIVATGETVNITQKRYKELLKDNHVRKTVNTETDFNDIVTGEVEEIKVATKEGTSYFYVKLKDDKKYYVLNIIDSENVILLSIGDFAKLEISETEKSGILVEAALSE